MCFGGVPYQTIFKCRKNHGRTPYSFREKTLMQQFMGFLPWDPTWDPMRSQGSKLLKCPREDLRSPRCIVTCQHVPCHKKNIFLPWHRPYGSFFNWGHGIPPWDPKGSHGRKPMHSRLNSEGRENKFILKEERRSPLNSLH